MPQLLFCQNKQTILNELNVAHILAIKTVYVTCDSPIVQVIMKDVQNKDLKTFTLPQFMNACVYEQLTDPQRVLHEIGVTPNSLKQSQLKCLMDIPLPSVFACFQRFVRWVDNGVYDFCNLPLAIKVHLSEEDVMFFELELREKWTGTTKELELEVKKMIEALKHSENDIIVNKQATRVSYFSCLQFWLYWK